MDDDRQRQWLDAHSARAAITRRLEARFGSSAEDVVATAIERAGQRRLRDEAEAAALTAHIAEQLGIDAWRRERTAAKYAPQLVDVRYVPSPEDLYLDRELRSRAAQAVQALPPDRREALVALADDVPVTEIAERLGRSVYAVKHLIARAREQVRAELRDVELAIGTWWARRRRSVAEVAASPALASVGSALVIALTVASPVVGPLLSHPGAADRPGAVALAAFTTDSIDAAANTSARGLLTGPRASRQSASRDADGIDGAIDVGQSYYDYVARPVVGAAPSSVTAKTGRGPTGVRTPDSGPRPYATHDDGDVVQDTLDCLAEPVITPQQIGCRRPEG
jgi:RNA polymerase sigma factor (sigma-70 family)